MKFAGIIAEYNPFHSGHAWQLAAARALGAGRIAVALSCGLTQRGSLPLLPDPVRARAALCCGADLVFALPAPFACAGAEAFARAGVRLLSAAGCDALVFGAETPDAALLMEAARVLLSPAYRAALREQLAGPARNFAAARQAAVEAVCPDGGLGALLDKPNNNLAVEYCKAILEQGASLTPCPLPRQGAAHNAHTPSGCYASASALRALWTKSGPDALSPYLPAPALALFRASRAAGEDADPAAESLAILSRLRARASQPEGFAGVRGLSEGLEHRLTEAVREAVSLPQLWDRLTTVRYPRARMRRLCMDAALGYDEGALPALPPYLHLLAGRKSALSLLGGAGLPVSHSLARLAKTDEACRRTVLAQAAASDLGALCRRSPAPMGLCYAQPPVLLPDDLR